MKVTADKKGDTRYFTAKLGWKEKFEPREIEVLSTGLIENLIKPLSVEGKKNNILKYDISQYSTMEFYLSYILNKEQFADMVIQCIEVFEKTQKTYLNYKNLVLDLDKIYIELTSKKIMFIYLPITLNKKETSIKEFFELIFKSAKHNTYEQLEFINSSLMYINKSPDFILTEFKNLIKQTGCSNNEKIEHKEVIKIPEKNIYVQNVYQNNQYVKAEELSETDEEKTENINFSQEDEDEENTICLDRAYNIKNKRFFLIYKKNNEKIEITQTDFIVGSSRKKANYCLNENTTISRTHAQFLIKEEKCFIIDLNSTNKTFINEKELVPKIENILNDGDIIQMSDEKFTFISEE